MRLLQRGSDGDLSLITVSDTEPPPYGILSHTWLAEADEVIWQDVQKRSVPGERAGYLDKPGYKKVDFCLAQAAKDGLQYVWVDTACINKDSQTELGKAINSMYRWYARAHKCYVYLTDVSSSGDGHVSSWYTAFQKSRWFTRGWTLQELLASPVVEFFSIEGKLLGTKNDLVDVIHGITNIAHEALAGHDLAQFSVQERFDWVTTRETKEPEDRVYCMFGILRVQIPPNYGEGEQSALRRLRDALVEGYRDDLFVLDFRQDRRDAGRVRNIFSMSGSRQPESAPNEEWLKHVRRSLSFEQQDVRRSTIKPPTMTTCTWLLDHPLYRQWLSEGDIETHCGLLWIKGKAGAGKSTLMKFADSTQQRQGDGIIISFYFNARGSELERTVEGMYRSLLCQLLDVLTPETRLMMSRLLKIYEVPPINTLWPIDTLQVFFTTMTSSLDVRLTVFIDALDECETDEVREMLWFLEDTGRSSLENGRSMLMCFASRYYPAIAVTSALEIRLEDESGHDNDLERHVTKTLRIGRDTRAQEIKARLLERANGVFVWTVLVIRLLNIDYVNGRVRDMPKRLEDLPSDMKALFKEIIDRDDSAMDELILCLQWVLYSTRPMSCPELYYALLATGGEHNAKAVRHTSETTVDDMRRYLSSCSKGLVETGLAEGNHTVVQFIHETVREFLLSDDGLQKMDTLTRGAARSIHARLQLVCKSYLDAMLREDIDKLGNRRDREEVVWEQYPFTKYAASALLRHMDQAVHSGTKDNFARDYDVDFWTRVGRLSVTSTLCSTDDSLATFLVRARMLNLLKHCLDTKQVTVHDKNKYGEMPLHEACRENGSLEIIEMLLDNGADIDATDDTGNTPLLTAISNDLPPALIGKLLLRGADARIGNKHGHTTLTRAIEVRNTDTIVMMLQDTAYKDVTEEIASSALTTAVAMGDMVTLSYLLDLGFDPNACSARGMTPLHFAIGCPMRALLDEEAGIPRRLAIISQLTHYGADWNALDSTGQTPMSIAYSYADYEVIENLLSLGIDKRTVSSTAWADFTSDIAIQIEADVVLARKSRTRAASEPIFHPRWNGSREWPGFTSLGVRWMPDYADTLHSMDNMDPGNSWYYSSVGDCKWISFWAKDTPLRRIVDDLHATFVRELPEVNEAQVEDGSEWEDISE